MKQPKQILQFIAAKIDPITNSGRVRSGEFGEGDVADIEGLEVGSDEIDGFADNEGLKVGSDEIDGFADSEGLEVGSDEIDGSTDNFTGDCEGPSTVGTVETDGFDESDGLDEGFGDKLGKDVTGGLEGFIDGDKDGAGDGFFTDEGSILDGDG